MRYKILNQYGLINGTTDSSFGPINPFKNGRSAEIILRFLKTANFGDFAKHNLVFAGQPHGDKIHICNLGDGEKIIEHADALITHHKNQILVVKTADCVPLLIYAPDKKVVAVIHAGRKSLTAEIIKKTIAKMVKNYGIAPQNLKIGLGPHIKTHDYFLKPKALKELKNTKWGKYFVYRKKQTFFDLTAATFDELTERGVKKENIEDSQICTFCGFQKYYSARKKEQNPRVYREKFPCFGSVIGMIDKSKFKNQKPKRKNTNLKTKKIFIFDLCF